MASVNRILSRNVHYNQCLTGKFPTQKNRELIGAYQGIKSAYQGSFLPDQGGVPWLLSPRSESLAEVVLGLVCRDEPEDYRLIFRIYGIDAV